MRRPRLAWVAVWLIGASIAAAADSPKITVDQLLTMFNPSQPGVDYDKPTDPAAIKACKVEQVNGPDGVGYVLRDGQGKILRRFLNTRGERRLDQWSYYQDGFEVFRDVDFNDDLVVDECRWLNSGGTRIATVVKSKITTWKRISAEEAAKVLTQAIVDNDSDLLETVMAKPEDLAALGVPKAEVDRVAAAAQGRKAKLEALVKSLKGWSKSTVWQRFDGANYPHVIPADSANGLKQDIILYENGVIFAGSPDGQGDATAISYLQTGELVQFGPVWKFVDLPRAVDPQKPGFAAAANSGVRAAIARVDSAGVAAGGSPEVEAAKKELADYDAKMAEIVSSGDKRELANYHVNRIKLLRNLVKVSESPEDVLTTNKQIADGLAAAYQTGRYPEGVKLLDTLVSEGGKIASYAAYRKIIAEYTSRSDDPAGDLVPAQKKLIADLAKFLAAYPDCDEAPDALLQLAGINEFNADDEEARKYYSELAHKYPKSEPGKKAAGALTRFDLVGKPLDLKGTGLDGRPLALSRFAGKTVLVLFWASWADPVRRELPELERIHQKFRAQGFEIVGVNLDGEKTALEQFLKEHPVSWPQIYEPGGMESRLADQFGIISLPTMILVDAQGKVVNRNIRMAADLEKQLSKLFESKAVSAKLGVNRRD